MGDPCLLLFARGDDPAVRVLHEHAPRRVVQATVADLSRAGWRYESGRPERATANAGGRVIPAGDIAAVVCRIPAIASSDLAHVHRADREYVAAEMTAFLYAWLAQFRGVRFNEPTWTSLAGPAWHPLQWARLAARVDVPVAPPARWLPEANRKTLTATVVCGSVFGVRQSAVVEYASRIARSVQSELLEVTFVRDGDWKLLRASPYPELDDESAVALLRRAFASTPSFASDSLCGAA